MNGTDYIFVSAAVVLAALIAALSVGRAPETKDAPREATRWRRFRISFGALHGPLRDAAAAVLEDPSGLKLLAAPRESLSPRRVSLLKDGSPVIDIVRGRLLFHRRLRVLLQGREWLAATVPGPGQKRPGLEFASPTDACEVQGNTAAREYELRKAGRLVASVSWQRAPGDDASRKEYVLEALKSEDPLPLVALAAAIEVALGPAKG
ncbi:MAG: hypothetical protein HY721_32290 [Planctomycetes bacterium]|nr:hypothetical protein [Planctomycetota bacterium]